MKYRFIFGPVPSRRLGISLGIDMVPFKTCSMNCVYCECGLTDKLRIKRKEYIPAEFIIKELKHYMKNNYHPDYITFSGSGEPTLNTGLGKIIDFIKSSYHKQKIAVITNSSFIHLKSVQKDLLKADLLLPSLDAAIISDFNKINRPHPNVDLKKIITGLTDLRKKYRGIIWLEILVIESFNTSKKSIDELVKAVKKIKPDAVHLNSVDRPPAERTVPTADKDLLEKLKKVFSFTNVEIVSRYKLRREIKAYRNDIENAILETVKRRPCTESDLEIILGIKKIELFKYLDVLEKEKRIYRHIQGKEIFIAGSK